LERLCRNNAKSKKCYLTALNRFNKFLERQAVLSDLDVATFARFSDWLDAKPTYTSCTCNDTRARLRSIWRFAWDGQLVSDAPPKLFRGRPRKLKWEFVPPAERSLRWLFYEFYVPLRLRSGSGRTRVLYAYTIRNFGRFLGREPMLSDLTDMVVSRMLAWMADRGLSPYTVAKEHDQLLAIWRMGCRKRLVEEWPDVDRGRLPVRIPKAWSRDDLAKLWAAIETLPGRLGDVAARDWWKALHFVLWYSAERIEAIRRLRWADVDLESGWLIIPAEFRKGGQAEKALQLPPVAIAALEKIREPRRGLIFPWPYSASYIYTKYAEILAAAGLSTDAKSKFHRMRKSSASHFEANGGNATALLGHSSRKVTMAYLDPRIVTQQQTSDLLFTPGEQAGEAPDVAKGGAA
jgi:integrase